MLGPYAILRAREAAELLQPFRALRQSVFRMLLEFQLAIDYDAQELRAGGGVYDAAREVEVRAKVVVQESGVKMYERQLGDVEEGVQGRVGRVVEANSIQAATLDLLIRTWEFNRSEKEASVYSRGTRTLPMYRPCNGG